MLKVWLVFWVAGYLFFPIKYLSLPLEASFKANSIWNDIIEKIGREGGREGGIQMRSMGCMGWSYQEGLGEHSSHTRFEVGDDSKIRFGMVYGVGIAFLDLFNIACLRKLPC
jgi:hypothetical protein